MQHEQQLIELVDSGASLTEIADTVGELGRLYHGFFLLDGNSLPQLDAAMICYEEARRLDGRDWRWPYLLAFAHQNRGDLESAARDYRIALDLNPDQPQVHHRLAEVELALGRFDEAKARWRHALGLDPEFAAVLYGLGHLALNSGDVTTAVEYLEKALQIEPAASRGHHTLGLAYRDLGESAKATDHLRQGGAVDFSLNDPLIEAMALLPSGSQALVSKGLSALLAGELEAAIDSFMRAVAADPINPSPRRNLALALEEVGRLAEAAEAYRELIELEPQNAWAQFSSGRLEAAQGQLEQAIHHLRRAVDLVPGFKQARYELASTYKRSRRWDEALQQYDAVLELDLDFERARTNRAVALVAVGRRDEGLRALRARVAAAPDDAMAWRSLSSTLRGEDRFVDAQQVLEEALERRSFEPIEEASLRLELGRSLALRDFPLEAVSQLETARRLAPDLVDVSYFLGLVQERLGRIVEAEQAFETVLDRRPTFGPARVGLAQSLQHQGKCTDAINVLGEGLRLSPSDRNLSTALSQLRSVC